jgi:hypothetical protein
MQRVGRLLLVVSVIALVAISLVSCAPSNYKLSTSSSPIAGGSISPASGTYDKNVGVDVTATPASGYRFDHWEGSASGTSPTVHLVMDSKKNLTAYFTKIYTLSVSSTPGNGGSISPNGGTYDEGKEVTLIAAPSQYYAFSGWGGDASGSSDHLTITMNSDKTIVASFSRLAYSLQTQVEPSGGGSVDPFGGTFDAGTHRTVTATPEDGYRFDHWGGSASGSSNPVSILVDSNKTITAYFTKVYTLTVTKSPVNSCTINPSSGTYDAETSVTLTATAIFPYAFDHWNGTDNDNVNPTTITMSDDESVTAYFRELSPGSEQTANQYLCGTTSIPIQMQAGQWLQGQIGAWIYDVTARIEDANGTVVKDLGRVSTTNFTFQAQTSGTYHCIISDTSTIGCTGMTFTYTIYS